MNFHIVIPARKDSKGVPFKNRLLLENTISIIPPEMMTKTIVSTNDDVIESTLHEQVLGVHRRSEQSAIDSASTVECLREVIDEYNLKGTIVMLYLTYPERFWSDILGIYNWYKHNKAKSLLCREEITKDHPYLCAFEMGDNKGKQVVDHNLYRRQDYPKCFRISWFVSMFETAELSNLNLNLYNEDTVYFPIKQALDIDTPVDMENLTKRKS